MTYGGALCAWLALELVHRGDSAAVPGWLVLVSAVSGLLVLPGLSACCPQATSVSTASTAMD